jgi:hypothetical protein
MTTTTRQTKAGQIERRLLLGIRCNGETFAIVSETLQRKTTSTTTQDAYTLRRIPSDIGGIAAEVTKQYADGEVYHVHLDKHLGDSCTCPGGTYKGNCRHLEMVKEGIRRGLI